MAFDGYRFGYNFGGWNCMKFEIIFLFILLLSGFSSALDSEVYDTLDDIKENPGAYTIVIGSMATNEDVIAAANLAGSFGIINNLLDVEVEEEDNLILIGTVETNNLIKEVSSGEMVVVDNNLIIYDSQNEKTLEEIDSAIVYGRDNKSKSNVDYSVLVGWGIGLLILLVIIGIMFWIIKLILRHKGMSSLAADRSARLKTSRRGNSVTGKSKDEIYLENYVKNNLAKGFSKDVVKKGLLKQGWNLDVVEKIILAN